MRENLPSGASGALGILMISDVYFPRVNGVSTSIASFRRELLAQGHRVTLVVPAYDGDPPDDDDDIVRVPGRQIPGDPEDRLMKRGALKRALAAIDPGDYDLVHIQTPFLAHYAGKAWARRVGLPVIETYHTFFEAYFHHYIKAMPAGVSRQLTRWFTRRQVNAVDALIVPSSALEDVMKRYGVSTPVHVLPTGLGPEDFRTTDADRFARGHGIDLDRPTLVYVGRVAHEKNIGFLVDMLAKVREREPDVQFLLAGEGPALGSIRARVQRRGLDGNVIFTGYLSRDGELQDCYACGDAFVFASRTETQGLVLLEAWACGVPLVSTAHLGTRDILASGRGALVPADDVDAFADAVVQLLGDPALRERLAVEAREEARLWTSEKLAARMTRVYRDLVSGRSASYHNATDQPPPAR
ncbi:glycosyltransferase family 4 protein [Marinihelvus fidelis]|uniref:Glycosyltransferase family 4 protein n=1 Tax=Marinihelvus fidelis TaxID=2613842 RepID=A0A5N0TD39_9GAMM|nr:glycosyltransferase [Marinihelvus fidelis]KAA9132598.1 glycosyltransferase family 4 protein [Marinihelvus fidelis]